MQTDPNSNLSLLDTQILLARCLYSFSYFVQESSEGKQKNSERSNPLTEARKGDYGLCTVAPPSAAKSPAGAGSQTT